jgi:hypothetical protein
MPSARYARSVFINCPFDSKYKEVFEAVVFAVADCGFRPRCAQEIEDSSQVRMEKIFELIEDCKLGIHDISRTDLDADTQLPRFNMPFELGLFLGAKRYGDGEQKRKIGLILDRARHRYQAFLSDIAGQDIQDHQGDPKLAIVKVRNWLRSISGNRALPGGKTIAERYARFCQQIPPLCHELRLAPDELTFTDYVWIVTIWLQKNA